MPDVPADHSAPQPGGRRLTGWKEIAAHLDRGVRTAQRWERDFALPVRRIGADRGESVFAYSDEIDRWLATSWAADADRLPNGVPDGEEAPAAEDAAGAGGADAAIRRSRERFRMGFWALAVVAVLLAAWASWSTWRQFAPPPPPPAAPADVRVDLDTMVVRDADGRTLWTRQFDFELAREEYGTPSRLPSLAGVGDVDGDGLREVWFAAIPGRADLAARAAFHLFDADGRLRWSHVPGGSVTFGGTTYAAPWRPYHLFVIPDHRAPARSVLWAVSHERTNFPCVLQRLDPRTGVPVSTYWSNGYIQSLALGARRGRPALLVGGVANEYRSASLAALDPDRATGSAPASQDKYRCTDCPPGAPLAFAVFPKPRRLGVRPTDPSGFVAQIDTSSPGVISVVVAHAVTATSLRAAGLYRLDEDFRPMWADTADGYQAVYEALVRDGAVPPFSPAAVDAERELLPLLRWAGGRFVPAPLAR